TAGASYGVGSNPYRITSGDLNADGKPDLAVADYYGNRVSVLLGTGGGAFGTAISYVVGTNPRGVMIADINADGKPDLITANEGSDNVSVLLGTGTGTFGTATA